MHKSFLITEEDKNRILGMHENATKRQYLNEGLFDAPYSRFVKDEKALPGVDEILNATYDYGTDPELLIKGFQKIAPNDFDKTEKQLQKAWQNATDTTQMYKSIQDMLRGEFEGNNLEDIEKLVPILKRLGYSLNYKLTSDKTNLDNNTITITKSTETGANTNQPTMPDCLKGGRWSDKDKVWWVKLSDGEYAFSQNGSYRKQDSKYIGYYKCENGKRVYSRTPFDKGKSTQTYPIPKQLVNTDGVIRFQTWMEDKNKGWFKGNRPIDGIFGPQTKTAWEKFGPKYMLSPTNSNSGQSKTTTTEPSQNVGPLAPQQPENTGFPSFPNTNK